jgi:hypothetical protein
MRVARFNVLALLTRSRPEKGTVEVNRDSNTVSVRPHKMHRTYDMQLDDVASFIVRTVIRAEVAEKRAAKKAARKARGR